jgi:hypothetical protein
MIAPMGIEKFWYRTIKIAAAIVGWGAVIISAAILFYQIATWLKTAIWEPYTIADALKDWSVPLPYAPHLLGMQKILDKLLSWPSIVGYAVIAVGGMIIFVWVKASLDQIERDERRAEQTRERAIRERAAKEAAEKSRGEFDFLGDKSPMEKMMEAHWDAEIEAIVEGREYCMVDQTYHDIITRSA